MGLGGVLGGWVGYLCKKERSEFGRERDNKKKKKKKKKKILKMKNKNKKKQTAAGKAT